MPEHVHLLLVPDLPEHPVSRVLSRIKEPFARLLLARWTEIDAPILERITDARGVRHVWQRGGGYDLNLLDENKERAKIDYIHLNPVSRGLVKTAREWRWSSARFYTDECETILPVG